MILVKLMSHFERRAAANVCTIEIVAPSLPKCYKFEFDIALDSDFRTLVQMSAFEILRMQHIGEHLGLQVDDICKALMTSVKERKNEVHLVVQRYIGRGKYGLLYWSANYYKSTIRIFLGRSTIFGFAYEHSIYHKLTKCLRAN